MQNPWGTKNLNFMAKVNILLSNGNTFRDKDEVLKDFLREQFDQEQDIIKCHEIIMASGHYGYYQLSVDMQKDLGLKPVIIHTLTNTRGLFDLTEKEASHG